ncbi:MAG: hypothetical protein JO305_05665 [Alphaproteobacteria bacterium]|nr:hypothetical protein [Alphaproteobacteria bacterium]
MSRRQRYVDLLTRIVPVGAVGVTLLLGSAIPGNAREQPLGQQPAASGERVSERLAAIRDAVSAVAPTPTAGETRQAQWWNNWHNWPWNNWHNWNNWHGPWNNWHNWHNW